MIRVINYNLSEKKLTEYKWDWHFAFFHFKSYKNCYLNGKPLKPYHILKNGDVIEIVERPREIFSAIGFLVGTALFGVSNAAVITATVVTGILWGATLAGVGLAVVGLAGAFNSGSAGTASASSTTTSKEYSSSTQPELKGASNDISDSIIPVLFGKTQQTPSYGQLPYRLVGDGTSTNKYRQYFVANYNNVVYSDFKLGETPVSDYSIDYIDVITASGSNSFIGWDNVKAYSIDEELSYNADEQVDQNAIYYYNIQASPTTITLNYNLKFSNVDISQWTNKTFLSTIRVIKNGTQTDLTQEVTITSGNLIRQDDNTYTYAGTVSHTEQSGISEVVYTQYSPVSKTRGNSTENTNELDALYVDETLTAGSIYESEINQSINKYEGSVSEVIITTPENTKDIDVIISFPQGLYKLNSSSGARIRRSSVIEIMYKQEGGQYQPISNANSLYVRDINGQKQELSSSSTTVNGAKVTVYSPDDLNLADQLFYRPIGFSLPKGKYTVRVRSADYSDKSNYDIGYPYCSEVQAYVDGNVLNRDILPRVNQISFEATAYKGLSGTLKQFNYIAEARIPIWNGTDWNTVSATQNPAAIIRYLLTDSNANPRPLSLDYIDNESLVHLYNWCEEQGYKASGIISQQIKTFDVIDEILKNCQGAMIPLLNGKHTFAVDGQDGKIPKGLFNQHNSWDFNWTPNVGRLTEAIRASYTDSKDYTKNEVTVYWYDGAVHEQKKSGTTDDDYLLVKQDLNYITDKASVLKSIKYQLETTQTKRNSFEFSVNLEALNMTLLDRVYISNSSNMQNEKTGLIKSLIIKNGYIKGFELYSMIDIPKHSQIIIRSLDYENERPLINIFDVLNGGRKVDKVYIEPINAETNSQIRGACDIKGLQDSWHYDGDLFALGQGTIYDCVVTDIKYNEDNTATITAREY